MKLLLLILPAFYSIPFVVSAVIRFLSPENLLGGMPSDRDFVTRVKVVTIFMRGLAEGILGYDPTRRDLYRPLSSFSKPFYVEGAYAGLQIAQYLAPWRARRNLRTFQEQHHRYIFLLAIGSGFSKGMRTFWRSFGGNAAELSSIDPRLQLLFFDGCAFQNFVFGYHKKTSMIEQGLELEGTAQTGFYEGAGRALWFLLPDFKAFQTAISCLPAGCVANCYVGFGIACGFAGCERVAAGALSLYPQEILASPDFHSGLIVGLFARFYIEPEFLKNLLAGSHPELLEEVQQASRLFDELWANGASYEQWRKALQDTFQPHRGADRFSLSELAPAVGR